MSALDIGRSFDTPVQKQEEDNLGRWGFAKNIYHLISSAPDEWSLRIAVFGSWGEGKTSILKFIENMAQKDNHVVSWFNPWEADSRQTLWSDFGFSIYDSLEKAGIKLRGRLKTKIRKMSKHLSRPAKSLASLDKRAEIVANMASSPLRYWLSWKDGEIRNIPKLIGDKKLIIMIDDLDRTSPTIVPNLLLSLRELLDIEQFVFVMAFDPIIVSKALLESHPGWESGDKFIDKIVDFPFWLPPISKNKINELTKYEFKKYCNFIDLSAVESTMDCYPENPRKRKQFIRNLSYLKPEIERHEADELNWNAILLSQLLKIEYSMVFDRIFYSTKTIQDIWSLLTQANWASDQKRIHENEEKFKSYLMNLLKELNIENEESVKRVLYLVDSIGRRSTLITAETLQYSALIGVKPHTITWKEFYNCYEKWEKNESIKDVVEWITNQASYRGEDVDVVFHEFFETVINYRLNLLERAADSNRLSDMESIANEALKILRLINGLCNEFFYVKDYPKQIGINIFTKMLAMVDKWFHFKNHDIYIELRRAEILLLIEFIEKGQSIAKEIVELLSPWSLMSFRDEIGSGIDIDIKCNLSEVAQDHLVEDLIKRFEVKDGIGELWGRGKNESLKYVMFRSNSPLWDADNRSKIEMIAANSKNKSIIHENFLEFTRMLNYFAKNGTETLSSEKIRELVNNTDVLLLVWNTAISQPIQPRLVGSFKEYKKELESIVGDNFELAKPSYFGL